MTIYWKLFIIGHKYYIGNCETHVYIFRIVHIIQFHHRHAFAACRTQRYIMHQNTVHKYRRLQSTCLWNLCNMYNPIYNINEFRNRLINIIYRKLIFWRIFEENLASSVTYALKKITTPLGKVKLDLWDTAEQERYRSINEIDFSKF